MSSASNCSYLCLPLEPWCSDSSAECSLFHCHFVGRWRSATSHENHMLFTVDAALRHPRKSICLSVPFVLYYRHIEWNNNASTVNHRHICGICMYVYMLKFCHIIAALWLCWNLGRQKIHCDIVSNIGTWNTTRGGEGKGKNRDTSFWNNLKIFDVLDNNLLFVYLAIIFPDKTSRQRGRGYKFE